MKPWPGSLAAAGAEQGLRLPARQARVQGMFRRLAVRPSGDEFCRECGTVPMLIYEDNCEQCYVEAHKLPRYRVPQTPPGGGSGGDY